MVVLVVPGGDAKTTLVTDSLPENLHVMAENRCTVKVDLHILRGAGDLGSAVHLHREPHTPTPGLSRANRFMSSTVR